MNLRVCRRLKVDGRDSPCNYLLKNRKLTLADGNTAELNKYGIDQ